MKRLLLTLFGIFIILILGFGSIIIGIRTGILDILIGIVFIISGILFIPKFYDIIYSKFSEEERRRKALGMGLLIFLLAIGLSFYSSKLLLENPPEIQKKNYKYLAPVKLGFYYGLIDKENNFFVQPKYDTIYYIHNAFVGIKNNNKTIISLNKNYDTKFQNIYGFIHNNIIIKKDNKFGLWNLENNSWTLSPEFDSIFIYLPNYLVIKQDSIWKILHIYKSFYLPFKQKAEKIFPINNDLFVAKSYKYKIVNKNNKIIVDSLEFIPPYQFGNKIIALKNKHIILLDTSGKILKNIREDTNFITNFYNNKFWFKQNNKFYLYDIKNRIILDSVPDILSNINEGICIIKGNGLWFYDINQLNKTKGYVITGSSWEEALPLIPFIQENKFGFKNKKGEIIIPAEYDGLSSYFYKIE